MIASSKLKSSNLPTLYIKQSAPRARKRFRSHYHFPPSPAGPSPAGPLFARARHGGLHVVLVPTVGPLRASARDGVEKRVALELIGVDRAIEGGVDVFCDRRRRTRRLRLYACCSSTRARASLARRYRVNRVKHAAKSNNALISRARFDRARTEPFEARRSVERTTNTGEREVR